MNTSSARPRFSPERDKERTRALFSQMPLATEEVRQHLRSELVQLHMPLVAYLAKRFVNRGEPYDDLVQVGTIGLLKSVDRFDLERGVEFSTFATPTIVGEIKRHFRDKGWAVRVPRRLQELRASITKGTEILSHKNGQAPTVAELAAHLSITEEEVLEGIESSNAYSATSLDTPEGSAEAAPALGSMLGHDDAALEGVEYRESLRPLLSRLPEREKRILMLRFFKNMTQSEVARELGISQMHVSRILERTLRELRASLLVEE